MHMQDHAYVRSCNASASLFISLFSVSVLTEVILYWCYKLLYNFRICMRCNIGWVIFYIVMIVSVIIPRLYGFAINKTFIIFKLN